MAGSLVTRCLPPGTLEPPECQTLVHVNNSLPVLVTCRSGLRTTCTRRPQEWPKRLSRTLWNKIAKWNWAELKSKYILQHNTLYTNATKTHWETGAAEMGELCKGACFHVLYLSILKYLWFKILILVTTKGGRWKNVILLVLLCLKLSGGKGQ